MKKARDLVQVVRRNFLTAHQPFKMDCSERYSYNPTLHWNPQVEDYFIKAYGADRFFRISKALTHPSCYSCIRVNTLKSTSDAVIEKLMGILQETEPESNVPCIGTGATADVHIRKEQNGFCKDPNLESFPDLCGDGHAPKANLHTPPICKCELPGIDNVVFVKGSGPHVIDYGDAHTQPVKEVIVSRKCAEAVLRGAQIFVPGVLACSAHVEKGDTVAVSVAVEQPGLDSRWGVGITRGTVLQGLHTDPHYLERKGLYIGQGTTMMSRTGIFHASQGIAVEMTNRVFNLASFNDVLEGEIFLQNLPSIITAHVLDPQPGERILDMCAAPGGKTTAIAILMREKGEVVAVDRSHNKVLDIQKLAAEMGLHCITTYRLDALKSVCHPEKEIDVTPPVCETEALGLIVNDSSLSRVPGEEVSSNNIKVFKTDLACLENGNTSYANQRIYLSKADIRKNIRRMRNGPGRNQCVGARVESSKGFNPNSFDRVLLDAPCSALGLRPRLFTGEETIESLRNHGKYQRKMFDQAVQLVRPGGVIVYSTCTINPGENEALVRYALDTYKFLSLAPQHPRVGGPGLVGHCEMFGGKFVEDWLRHDEAELVQRFDPLSPLDTIGFFIAKFNVGQKDI